MPLAGAAMDAMTTASLIGNASPEISHVAGIGTKNGINYGFRISRAIEACLYPVEGTPAYSIVADCHTPFSFCFFSGVAS